MAISRTENPTSNYTICTSSTRPANPIVGQLIYETDTGKTLIYNGTDWEPRANMTICTSSTRPSSPFQGMRIYETDTDKVLIYSGADWVPYANIVICTSSTRPTSPFAGLVIYETDTDLMQIYDGTEWQINSPVIPHTSVVRVTQSSGSKTGSSFSSPPTAVTINNFTKHRSDTKIVYNVLCTAWKSSGLGNLFIGVNDGTTTTETAGMFYNSTGFHHALVGATEVTGLSSGTYNFSLLWRVSTGSGNVDANDWWSLSVTETF